MAFLLCNNAESYKIVITFICSRRKIMILSTGNGEGGGVGSLQMITGKKIDIIANTSCNYTCLFTQTPPAPNPFCS